MQRETYSPIGTLERKRMLDHPVHVTSEIGKLRSVILHRPGKEVENLTPEYLQRFLFDDIPYLPMIKKEHDVFAGALRKRGVEVLYLENLLTETLDRDELRERFIKQVLAETNFNSDVSKNMVKDYLLTFPADQLVEKVMAGILKTEIKIEMKKEGLNSNEYPFYLDPLPNLYFTRDPAAIIGEGISINRMREEARRRESMFIDYIFKYHPRFSRYDIPVWMNRDNEFSIEGGDELVLSKEVIAIGISSRTSDKAIKQIAENLFMQQSNVQKVVAVEIPKSRAFMHLDTVFTMVDYDKFTIHPAILGPNGKMNIYILERGNEPGNLKISTRMNLLDTLKEVLHQKEIELIPCGGGDAIASAREQWNDGSNTLAIAPGVVVTYDRNYVSNDLLRKSGIEVIEVPSSELSRGRGGPRCMSMPIIRDDI